MTWTEEEGGLLWQPSTGRRNTTPVRSRRIRRIMIGRRKDSSVLLACAVTLVTSSHRFIGVDPSSMGAGSPICSPASTHEYMRADP